MDYKDRELMELLCSDGKLTVLQLAKKTGIPPTTVHNRIKRMENEGIIRGYTAIIDRAKTGLPISAFILITISYEHATAHKLFQQGIAETIRKMPGVDHSSIVTGATDILIKVNLESLNALNEFLIEKLRNVNGIDKTQTLVILKEF